MRLHSLRMHAVGPFADEQVIDFDRLGSGGLFLFEGPTGVGKSTILDALTFALYGGLASEAGDPARMRSDFAGPDDQPQVQLEFSVRGGRHRITRSPEHVRPKKRGTGVTKEKASVHLERLVGDQWDSRSHAKDEVGTIIGELLGLTREQFSQVVLLPQGEFATFLRAGDDERRELLGKLFGTQFFRRITEGLQARAQEATRTLQAADAELRARLAAACEAAGLERDQHVALAGAPIDEGLDALAVLDAELTRRAQDADVAATAADGAQRGARESLVQAQEVTARLAQRSALEAALIEAEEQRPGHEARRRRAVRARQAIPVRPLVDILDRAAEQAEHLRLAVVAASPGGVPAAEHLEGHGWQALTRQSASARTAAGEIAHLVLVEDDLAAGRDQLAQHRAHVQDLQASWEGAHTRASQLPDEVAAARAELARAQQRVASAAQARAVLDAVSGQAQAAGRVADLTLGLEEARVARRSARRAHDEAHDLHGLLVDQRLADVRGELAARLVSGDPCLVCGAQEHPAPATWLVAGVSEEQVRQAAARRDDARVLLDGAEMALVRAEAQLEHAVTAAGGRSAEQWQTRIAHLDAEVDAGERAQEALAALAEHVTQLGAEQDELAGQLLRIAESLAGAQMKVAHAAGELADREEQVAAAREQYGSVRERAAALVAAAEGKEELGAAVSDLSTGLEHLAAACERAHDEAISAGFADVPDARAALLDATALAELEHSVEQWEAAISTAQAQLGSDDLRKVAGVDPEQAAADARDAAAELERSTEQARQTQRAASVATRALERFAERLVEVRQCAEQRAELAVTGKELLDLDQYARGMAGSPRMSLVTFVLRYWFEQVVAAANLRLASMSAGKYELLRVDEAARKDARVGLGLAVLDRHTGRERSPATLSGGETFYTSLALALGLADVVVAQAGGAQLDTLFIDEGFGSLDPDTLDDVMGVIDELRGNGRVIGIVSHVPELKERIAERLTVRRARPDGPSTVAVRA